MKHNQPRRRGGMLAVGIAVGVALVVALDNIAIGIAVGLAVGAAMAGWQARRDSAESPKDTQDD